MSERWIPIPGFEGYYEVSDQGQVRSLDRYRDMPASRRHPEGRQECRRGRVLKQATDPTGHKFVNLCVNTVPHILRVHVLVLTAFCEPRPEGAVCRHLNGNPADNRPGNLRWGTYSENAYDKVAHGNHHQARKTHCKRGHELTGERDAKGYRTCKTCQAMRGKAWAEKYGRRRHPATSAVACLMVASALIGSAIGLSVPAHADPVQVYSTWKADAVCNWFAQHPDASAVAPMFKAISDDTGYNDTDTARVLVTAVGSTCPQFMPVLQRFVDLNPPAPTYKASGRIGGVLR